MNIYEMAEEFKISLKKLKAMEKRGCLRVDGSAAESDPIRATLAKGNRLPVPQLVQLVEAPALLIDLGRFSEEAERQVAELDKPQAAPRHVAGLISEAAKNEPEAVADLMAWIKATLPAGRSVGHSWLAVRLLLGVPASTRKYEAPRIGRALLNIRNRPEFAGWWTVKPGVSQNSTLYHRGTEKGFDL